jgi:hypothetical protein
MKLASVIQKETAVKTAFFWGLWAINAFATAVFGAQYLPSLFSELTSWLPAGDALAMGLAILSSLVVFDVAFKCWQYVGTTAETSTQRMAAVVGEWTSFIGSLAYTVITLSTVVFPVMATAETTAFMTTLGGVIFIFEVALHLVLMKVWAANSIEARELDMETEEAAAVQTERLAYRRKVVGMALLLAKGGAEAEAERLASMMGNGWAVQMTDIATPDQKQLPPNTIEGEKPQPAAQPAQTRPNLPENEARVAQPPIEVEAPPVARREEPQEEWEEIPVYQVVERVRPEPYLNGHGSSHPKPASPFGD